MNEDDSEKQGSGLTRRSFLAKMGLGSLAAGIGLLGAKAEAVQAQNPVAPNEPFPVPTSFPEPVPTSLPEPMVTPISEPVATPFPDGVPTPQPQPTNAPIPVPTPTGIEQLAPQPTPSSFSLYLPTTKIYSTSYPTIYSNYNFYFVIALIMVVVLFKKRGFNLLDL